MKKPEQMLDDAEVQREKIPYQVKAHTSDSKNSR